MKDFILKFKKIIKFLVAVFVSREFAFVFCVLGTIAQISHTFFLVESISSLDGYYKTIQAFLLATFISASLLFFTAISTNDDTIEAKKINLTVTLFTVIEILINIYYYSRHLIIDRIAANLDYQIFDFVFAVLVSSLIPITIKLYSGLINATEWIKEFETIPENELITSNDKELIFDEKYFEENPIIIDLQEFKSSQEEKVKVFDKKLTGYKNDLETVINSFDSNKKEISELIESYTSKNINDEISKPEIDMDLLVKEFGIYVDNKFDEILNSKKELIENSSDIESIVKTIKTDIELSLDSLFREKFETHKSSLLSTLEQKQKMFLQQLDNKMALIEKANSTK